MGSPSSLGYKLYTYMDQLRSKRFFGFGAGGLVLGCKGLELIKGLEFRVQSFGNPNLNH